MAGIVTSNKTRKLVGNRLKEIDVPTTTLNTALFYADLTAQGAAFTAARVNAELNAYPTVVKNNASLALTPSANKAGVVYAMNGDSKTLEEFEFQRGSSGTYFDASGVMQLAAPNVPRINFENGVAKGLLIEPASSNLITDSGLVNGLSSFGSMSTVGVEAVQTLFNMGPLLQYGIKLSRGGSTAYAYKAVIIDPEKTYAFTCFIKKTDNTIVTTNDFGFPPGTIVNNISLNSVGNSIYKLKCTISQTSRSGWGVTKRITDSDVDIIITGFQLEEGSVATSYIPTTSAVATRLADKVLSKRPTAVFNKNSMYVKTAEYPSVWFGNGVDVLEVLGRNILLSSSYTENVQGIGRTLLLSKQLNINNTLILKFNSLLVQGNAPTSIMSKLFRTVAGNGETKTVHVPFSGTHVSFLVDEGMLTSKSLRIYSGSNTADSNDIITKISYPKLEQGNIPTLWSPAPEDYVKVDVNGNIEISYTEPIHLQQFSLISRELSQEEV